MLLSLGMLGIYFELATPGAILPGVVGAICLILGFYGLSVLPVSYAGVALLILAAVLFVLEIKVAGFGVLGAGGVVCAGARTAHAVQERRPGDPRQPRADRRPGGGRGRGGRASSPPWCCARTASRAAPGARGW